MIDLFLGVGRPTGIWCKLSGFVAIMAITALNSGAVCVAFVTYRYFATPLSC